jgi:hypothetical protein
MLELPNNDNIDDVSSVIVQKSHSLNNIHLRFSAQDRNRYFPLPAVPTFFAYSRHTLFSVATKLTILNYDLGDIATILSIPIFHTLRALAVADYPNSFYFYMRTLWSFSVCIEWRLIRCSRMYPK